MANIFWFVAGNPLRYKSTITVRGVLFYSWYWYTEEAVDYADEDVAQRALHYWNPPTSPDDIPCAKNRAIGCTDCWALNHSSHNIGFDYQPGKERQ